MKPLESFMDKLIYRQLDIHDCVRTKVKNEEYVRFVEFLQNFNLRKLDDSPTKLGNRSANFIGKAWDHIENKSFYIWIEVQEENIVQLDQHIEYEIARYEYYYI